MSATTVQKQLRKTGLVAAVSFTGTPKKYAVTFTESFPDDQYTISIDGVDARSWSYESKTAAGFTINANANAALTGEVSWEAFYKGEVA